MGRASAGLDDEKLSSSSDADAAAVLRAIAAARENLRACRRALHRRSEGAEARREMRRTRGALAETVIDAVRQEARVERAAAREAMASEREALAEAALALAERSASLASRFKEIMDARCGGVALDAMKSDIRAERTALEERAIEVKLQAETLLQTLPTTAEELENVWCGYGDVIRARKEESKIDIDVAFESLRQSAAQASETTARRVSECQERVSALSV